MSRTDASPSRLNRAVRLLLWTLLALEIVYLVGANVFLNTFLSDRVLNRRPERSAIRWQSGWTLIPVRVHLKSVVFDRHGSGQGVHAEARRVAANVSLWALLGRRFSTHTLKVEGLTLDIQRHSKKEMPASGAKRGVGRRIALRGIEVVDVESFTFDHFVAKAGEARLRGDVELQVRGEVTVPRVALDWRDVELFRGDEVLAEPMTVTFDGDLAPFLPKRDKGLAVLEQASGRLRVEGVGSRLAILKLFLRRAEWIETLDGYGQLRADLVIDRGQLAPGSELEATADGLRLDFLGYATEGAGTVTGEVEAKGDGGQSARMEVLFDDFTVRRKPALEPYIEGQGFHLVATTSDPNLRDGMTDLEVILDMPEAAVPNMAVYGSLLPADLGISLDSGSGVASLLLQGSVVDQTASGFLRVAAEKVAGHFQELGFEASLEMDTRISGGNLDELRLEIQGTRLALVDGVFIDDRNTRETDWWMTVDVAEGTVLLGDCAEETKCLPKLAARVDIGMKDSRPVIALFAELKTWLQRFERILTVKDVWARGEVSMEEGNWTFNGLTLEGRKLMGLAELELGEEERRGILYVKFHGIPVGLELMGTERDWKLTGVRKWYDRKVAEEWASGEPEPATAEPAEPSAISGPG